MTTRETTQSPTSDDQEESSVTFTLQYFVTHNATGLLDGSADAQKTSLMKIKCAEVQSETESNVTNLCYF